MYPLSIGVLLVSLMATVAVTTTTTTTTTGYQPLTILNQSNVYQLFYDLSNHIECDNYTDYFIRPVLRAADDFVLPPYTSLDTMHRQSSDCNALQFTFVTLRTRQDQDPSSVTLQLFYNNASGGYNGSDVPQDQPFYTRSWCAPNAISCQWDPRLATPLNTTLTLNNGDMADDGVTRFDLSNLSLMPIGRRLWVSFFATVPRHYARNILRSNTLYWMTLNNLSGSTPVVDPLDANQGLANAHYQYRDALNTKYNATRWTDATVIQPLLGVHTTTYNMAWRLALVCDYLEPVPPLPPNTPAPTRVPTTAPTTTSSPSQAPTDQPTDESNNNSTPTTTTTESPTSEADSNTASPTDTPTNATDWMNMYAADRQTQIIVYSVVGSLILCVLCCLCIYCWRKRRCCFRKSALNIDDYLRRSQAKDTEMKDLGASSSYADYNPLHQKKQPRDDSNDDGGRMSLTGTDFYTPVSLTDDDCAGQSTQSHVAIDDDSTTRDWLHSMAPTHPTTVPQLQQLQQHHSTGNNHNGHNVNSKKTQ